MKQSVFKDVTRGLCSQIQQNPTLRQYLEDILEARWVLGKEEASGEWLSVFWP